MALPEGLEPPGLLVRSQVIYPINLWEHWNGWGCWGRTNFMGVRVPGTNRYTNPQWNRQTSSQKCLLILKQTPLSWYTGLPSFPVHSPITLKVSPWCSLIHLLKSSDCQDVLDSTTFTNMEFSSLWNGGNGGLAPQPSAPLPTLSMETIHSSCSSPEPSYCPVHRLSWHWTTFPKWSPGLDSHQRWVRNEGRFTVCCSRYCATRRMKLVGWAGLEPATFCV